MSDLIKEFTQTREYTEKICRPLAIEDYIVQTAPFVSPLKWHLAHTTWFFEEFILKTQQEYEIFDEHFSLIFNSYYKTCGKHWVQEKRGHLSRPTVQKIYDYRSYVDERIQSLLEKNFNQKEKLLLKIGIEHEKQHQELMFMDLKYNLSQHPFDVSYFDLKLPIKEKPTALKFVKFEEKIVNVGADYKEGHTFDNETPTHKQLIPSFNISERLITNGEYLEFIKDGGYENEQLWLSDGLMWVQQNSINMPLYWSRNQKDDVYNSFTLYGTSEVDLHSPVTHLSFYEANAFANWYGARLPTEFEWEAFARENEIELNERWQWCSSSYEAYPGYRRPEGALGEYNQKFMCNQKVLRGGCHYTPSSHIRYTYRNFYYPDQRWMFSGLRLIRN